MKLVECMQKFSTANDSLNITEFKREYIRSYAYCLYNFDTKTWETIEMTTLLVFLTIVGVIGNILVIVVYAKHQTKPTTTYFIIALAVHDLLLSGILMPYQTIISYVLIPRRAMWICGVIEWFNDTLLITSVFFLVEIAVDRYYAVCRPLKFAITPRRARKIIAITVIACALQGIPSSISEGGFVYAPYRNSTVYLYTGDYKEGTDLRYIKPTGKAVMDRYFFFLFIALSLTIIVCYVHVFVVVCKRMRAKKATRPAGSSDDAVTNSTDSTEMSTVSTVADDRPRSTYHNTIIQPSVKKSASIEQRRAVKLAQVLLVVTLVFIFSWLPYFGIRLKLVKDHKALSVTYFLSNALNPVLYCFTNVRFRTDVRKLFQSCIYR
ncbi:cholecystokinin receptor-like [Tubulanus polymorphus]|uniref:cholecystokinin receptor-like n=1 Tax=Tubulanus polymorphus TaxID=672921 RepID=UPI003DA3A2AF